MPVPECVNPDGFAADCALANSIRLWPQDFKPASAIPKNRDSTDRVAANTIPGRNRGHEIFSSVDVVNVGGVSRRLFVSYTTGIQAWDIETNPADPTPLNSVDGWAGEFLDWPNLGEVLEFIEGISAVNVSSTRDLVAVAGNNPVGAALFEYIIPEKRFRQLYQHPDVSGRQVKVVKRNDGTVYAFIGADEGVHVYNVSTAMNLPSPCIEGSLTRPCPVGVNLGVVRQKSGRFIDAIHVPSSDRVFLSSASGFFTNLELYELAQPQFPENAILRFSGLKNTLGNALFEKDGHYYLAAVNEADGIDKEKLRILLIDNCMNGSNCSLDAASVKEVINPIPLDGFPTSNDFIDYSEFGGKPYLYYSFGTGGLFGSDVDQLFDAGSLQPPNPLPLPGLPEITRTGGSYVDPCNAKTIRYWSHYYSRNYHGLNEMAPRSGKFGSAGYFYRAAGTILDVHLLGDGGSTGAPGVDVTVVNPKNEYWMTDDEVTFNAAATGSCDPSFGVWQWTATPPAGVAPVVVATTANQQTYRFDCLLAGRCTPGAVNVRAENTSASCVGVSDTVSLTLKDPDVAITSLNAGGSTSFVQCQNVPFAATLAGRGPVSWQWELDGNVFAECSGSNTGTTDLASTSVTCLWPAAEADPTRIFIDSFESGDVTRWNATAGFIAASAAPAMAEKSRLATKLGSPTEAKLVVWDETGSPANPTATSVMDITVATGDPQLDGPVGESVVGSSATLTAAASFTTLWSWEIEDPSGASFCTFAGVPNVKCIKQETTTNTLTHGWTAAGTYRYNVTVSNCASAVTASATGDVTVEAGVEPVVMSFGLKSLATAPCCLIPGVGYMCAPNVDIEFAVTMQENASYTFKFDWDRTSQATKTFAPENPSSFDAGTLKWFFTHRFNTAANVYPIVRVEQGGFADERDFFSVPLVIGNSCSN